LVDCERCRHFEDDDYCLECEHRIDFLTDHYDPLPDEEFKQREAMRFEEALRSIKSETVQIENPSTIKPILPLFDVARKYTGSPIDRPYFASVYFATDRMVATNGHRLIEIKCSIPGALQKKHILEINEDGEARVSLEARLAPDKPNPLEGGYLALLGEKKKTLRTTKAELMKRIKPYEKAWGDIEPVILCLDDVEIAVNKALEVFGDNELIEVGYGDLYESVIFKNDWITVVVMPLRV
jgi:hypothetical protein